MTCNRLGARALVAFGLLLSLAVPATGQAVRTEIVDPGAAVDGVLVAGRVQGDETAGYLVDGRTGQTLSVDLAALNGALSFNILPHGQDAALFIGSTSGTVADLPLPADGVYEIEVYLMRSAARRGEWVAYSLRIGLSGGDFADGLASGSDWWQVAGLASGALNIRSGPDSRYDVVGKARNGEVLQNWGCRMTGAARWCSIRVEGSDVQGWVVGSYLTEAAAPAVPEMPDGGPVGNGAGFDATGLLPCVTAAGEAERDCPFGVVRDGPGNAGLWIAIGGGPKDRFSSKAGFPFRPPPLLQ